MVEVVIIFFFIITVSHRVEVVAKLEACIRELRDMMDFTMGDYKTFIYLRQQKDHLHHPCVVVRSKYKAT